MSRSVYEQQPRDVELLASDERSAHLVDVLDRNLCGSDMLSDRTGLSSLDGGSSDPVEELGLTVVDVTQNTDYRLSYGRGKHL